MRRRILLICCAGLAGLLVAAAALPWWLGWALERAGPARGLTFGRYERIGYTRFALHAPEYRHAVVHVTATRLEMDTPLVAWARRGPIAIGQWTVAVTPRVPPRAGPPAVDGWVTLRALLARVATQLDRWAPQVRADAGVVRWPGASITCLSAQWAGRTVTARGVAWRELQADASLALAPDVFRLELQAPSGGLHWESRGATVTGTVRAWKQNADFSARFGDHGWLPAEATLRAADWSVPGAALQLGELYATVRGHGHLDWREQRLTADFAVTGVPEPGKSAPPLTVQLRGHGSTEAFTLESLEVKLPGIDAHLTEAVTVERSGAFRAGGARFTLNADLAQLPWLTARGTVTGEARLAPDLGKAPVVEFQLRARDVAAFDWAAALIEAQGRFAWPQVRVTAGTLTGTAGEQLAWRGGWDFASKQVLDAVADGHLQRATVARWLPPDLDVATIALHAEAAGGLPALRHRGSVQAAGVKYATLNPVALDLTWSGQASRLEVFAAKATAGETTLALAGETVADAARLTALELFQGGTSRLRLQEPARVLWRPRLQIDRLQLVGPEGGIDASGAWGETGSVALTVKSFASAWLSEFGVWRGPAWHVSSLQAKAAWDRGPMTYSVAGHAAIEWRAGKSAEVALNATGDESGLRLADLEVVEDTRSAVRVVGRIPVRFSPAAASRIEFLPAGALALEVTTAPEADFWRELAAHTGIELQEPEAMARVTGTWARPQGTARLRAARVAADPRRFPGLLPTMEALELELAADPEGLRLESLAVKIEGLAVRASGKLPMTAAAWRTLWQSPPSWANPGAEARIEVPDGDLAALARFLPAFAMPKGRLQANVSYARGALHGSLILRDAATRPLGPLGVLQEINAELTFVGSKVELRDVTAQSGGQTVTLSGTVEWPALAAALADPRSNPPAIGVGDLKFDVALRGDNLPFVRQTGVLVRGDLDLKLTSPTRGPPRISGAVRLRESIFLSDLRALLPGGARTQARLPPYFAVTIAPYDKWRLEVAVTGERFLKLRTALFNGLASARFQLGGSLGEPSARGEATLDAGVVKLPFATFVVQEGRVTLAPEQGVEPQIWLVGTVRRLSHDLRLEASGPASAPVLLFTSSPPLESGQVLLMVMTGEAPHDGAEYTDRQRMARLGTFLGQSLVSSLGGESEAGERLSLSTGENVSRQGRETYGMEYRLSERWSLVGEYDEFDDFNAGVKWRVYSRGGVREEKK